MNGILKLSYKLLVNDKPKFLALLVGIAFAVFLMMLVTSTFYGILTHSSATVINIGAPIWVMDPSVETPADAIGMPDHVLDVVRSMPEVKYAVPLYSGVALVKLPDGTFQSAMVIGLDDTSLVGRPELIDGNIDNIYAENGFIAVDDVAFPKLGNPHIGSELELNDHRCVIVGIAKVSTSTLFGQPTLYTTYQRAIHYLPNPRYTTSYVLVQPKSPADIAEIKRQVKALGYVALTKNEFIGRTAEYYVYHTGVGMNMLIMTVMSFIVGLSISGQTFYTFILENLDRFGALKAIGSKRRDLIGMIFFQAVLTSLTGYGLGIGSCTALIAFAKYKIPEYFGMITYLNIILPFVMILIITCVSSYFGVRRVLQIEPFGIFRG
ncbi:MAG: FtsX-like permease family protein [Acidobacteria bacterium]|nr:MAG: FtsX-like permease family protein [Acidobacteriota bacterium]